MPRAPYGPHAVRRPSRSGAALLGLALWLLLGPSGCGSEPDVVPDDAAPATEARAAEEAAAQDADTAALEPAPEPEEAPAADVLRPRGLWVLAEGSRRVLEDPARIDPLIADARALGASDLFVQVYRGGRAWYDATLADPAPYRATLERSGGVDTLALLLERAHAAGLRVHAWVNVLSLSGNTAPPIVRELGRAAVHVDNRGRSLLDYPQLEVPAPDGDWYRMGTRGVYLDPAAPGVADWLVAAYRELVTRYPTLDGLHLDYIRHPDVLPFVPGSRFGVGLDFGYGVASRERFRRETGLEAPFDGKLGNANRWDAWRRDRVTELVARIAEETRAARPGLAMSAAVASHVDRAYLSLFQDWQRWLEDGSLDFAITMAYTLDDRLLRYQADTFARSPLGPRLWTGLGTWLFAKRPEGALDQIEIARRAGAVGDALFSYDSIADAPALRDALARDVAARRAPPEVDRGG